MSIDFPALWQQTSDAVLPVLKNTGGVAAAIALCKLVLDWWRRTFGRRRHWLRSFRQLALRVQLDYVEELFGKAAYKRVIKTDVSGDQADADEVETVTEYVWPLATHGYLQVIADSDEIVIRYSLTTASRLFRPKVRLGQPGWNSSGLSVRLGRTRFASLPSENLERYDLDRGASHYEYSEVRYYGRPAGYAYWTASHNQAGIGKMTDIPFDVPSPSGTGSYGNSGWLAELTGEQHQKVRYAQAKTTINTVTVALNGVVYPESQLLSLGPRTDIINVRITRPRRVKDLLNFVVFRYKLGSGRRQRPPSGSTPGGPDSA